MKKLLPKDAVLIPAEAKKVFAGEIFDVYQWPQKMFDGSTETFEMLKRPDTVQILAVKDGKLVMVNDAQPNRGTQLHFPGGRVDDTDADWLAAARREMLEETGCRFKNWRLIAVYQPAMKVEHFAAWFLATDFASEQEPHLDNGEKIETVLYSFDDVKDKVMGADAVVSYAIPLFIKLNSLEDVLAQPEFTGQEAER